MYKTPPKGGVLCLTKKIPPKCTSTSEGRILSSYLVEANEEETVEAAPDNVGAATVRAQPASVLIVSHEEDAQVADHIRDGFHCNMEPFIHGLVGVLQFELWVNLCGAEVKATLSGTSDDCVVECTFGESELIDRTDDKINVHLLGTDRRLLENIIRPVAYTTSRFLEWPLQRTRILVGAEGDGAEDHRER